jgi:hypothetical protein
MRGLERERLMESGSERRKSWVDRERERGRDG